MPPLMLYDPIRRIPKPYPSEAQQFREYTKCEAWYYDPYTGYNRSPDEVNDDPLGYKITPPIIESSDDINGSIEVSANTDQGASLKAVVEVGDSTELTATGDVDKKGKVSGKVGFKVKF